MDPLSEVLSLINVRAARWTRFEASGKWAFRFPTRPFLKFGAVIKGKCWIRFEGGMPQYLEQGDAFLLANAPEYVLANDDGAIPKDGMTAFDWHHSNIAHHEGDDTVLVAGSFSFDTSGADLLLKSLPKILTIEAKHHSAGNVRNMLAILDTELRERFMGASVVTDRLADILLVQVLRSAVEEGGGDGLGWLAALAHPRIGKTLAAMHGDVAYPWKVDELAKLAAMSRSAFSTRFKTLTGLAPLDYLLRWRMRVARDKLRHGSTVATVAASIGYSSESAFGNAFKRVYGQAPKRYSQTRADFQLPRRVSSPET